MTNVWLPPPFKTSHHVHFCRRSQSTQKLQTNKYIPFRSDSSDIPLKLKFVCINKKMNFVKLFILLVIFAAGWDSANGEFWTKCVVGVSYLSHNCWADLNLLGNYYFLGKSKTTPDPDPKPPAGAGKGGAGRRLKNGHDGCPLTVLLSE